MRTDIDALVRTLRQTLPIAELESHEAQLKGWLVSMLEAPLRGEEARLVAEVQRRIGFLFKFKSYAVKCATPLGYSVFFQQPGEGFSFQRHLTHKVEVFHVLEPLGDARVFLCDSESWSRAYERESFSHWLQGSSDPSFDCFARTPEAGDVYNVHSVGVVHSVLGCVVEEFANASTDMVDRLHDQNEGRDPAPLYAPEELRAMLRSTPVPVVSRMYSAMNGLPVPVPDVPVRGGSVRTLSRGTIEARRIRIEPGASTDLEVIGDRATTVFIARGSGEMVLCDAEERTRTSPPVLAVEAGDVLLVPPGSWFGFAAGAETMHAVQHSVTLDVLTA